MPLPTPSNLRENLSVLQTAAFCWDAWLGTPGPALQNKRMIWKRRSSFVVCCVWSWNQAQKGRLVPFELHKINSRSTMPIRELIYALWMHGEGNISFTVIYVVLFVCLWREEIGVWNIFACIKLLLLMLTKKEGFLRLNSLWKLYSPKSVRPQNLLS